MALEGIFSAGYGVVPKNLLKKNGLKTSTKLVLCYMLSYTGSGDKCFPSISLMADDLGMSKSTVMRSIKDAEKNGVLIKTQVFRGKGNGKKNIYELPFMKSYESAKKKLPKVEGVKKDVEGVKDTALNVASEYSNNNINNNTTNTSPTGIEKPVKKEHKYSTDIHNLVKWVHNRVVKNNLFPTLATDQKKWWPMQLTMAKVYMDKYGAEKLNILTGYIIDSEYWSKNLASIKAI